MTWAADDQGKALAWMIEQRGKCPKCGTFHWEHGTDSEPTDAYEADGLHCPGCELLERESDRRQDQPSDPGVRLVLYPKGLTDGP